MTDETILTDHQRLDIVRQRIRHYEMENFNHEMQILEGEDPEESVSAFRNLIASHDRRIAALRGVEDQLEAKIETKRQRDQEESDNRRESGRGQDD